MTAMVIGGPVAGRLYHGALGWCARSGVGPCCWPLRGRARQWNRPSVRRRCGRSTMRRRSYASSPMRLAILRCARMPPSGI